MPTVSVVNMKGGVAKTTLAVNLADALVQREELCILLVDLDPQFNATQCVFSGEEYVAEREKGAATILNIFDDRPAPIISPITGPKASQPPELKSIKPWKTKRGFDMVAGDLELHRLDMGGGQGREQRLKRYLEAIDADSKYDFVIIDTPPTPSHWMMAALLASDAYIVPVKPEPLSRTGIDLLRGVVDRCASNFGHPIECLGVVLTIVEANTIVFRDAREFLDQSPVWQGKRFTSFLPKRIAVASAQGNQQFILDLTDYDIKRALSGITEEFLGKFSNV